ncbi:MAG: hypothetical protein J5965_09375 [Aeriscardovia sp.]|nr:hypothetical protein [Aeriscardovia sp.]MBP3788666.1 hypothetical protein [Prevotella sp.]MBP3842385.1 hypothetical protein [Prevotella sp.]
MKRKLLIVFVLLSILAVQAREYSIVIKSSGTTVKGNTEVSLGPDSIVVKPATDITVITVAVTDVNGEVLSEQVLPAQSDATVHVNTPSSSDGYTLELRDDNGLIYSEDL